MIFKFKSFDISQSEAAMKVGTDGVLLGAWANPTSYPHKILDIGTGTGLIAIMLAQRFSESNIEAIEIDKLTCIEAQSNAQASPWAERIQIAHCSLQNYSSAVNFDLIVCNPPFFSKTTKPNNQRRALARNSESLELGFLIEKSHKLLNEHGMLALVLPSNEYTNIQSYAQSAGLFITQICWVRGNEKSPVKRLLIGLSKKKATVKESDLTIENSRHNYTEDYKKLCEDFYLKL